jgi:hypothetical protein
MMNYNVDKSGVFSFAPDTGICKDRESSRRYLSNLRRMFANGTVPEEVTKKGG